MFLRILGNGCLFILLCYYYYYPDFISKLELSKRTKASNNFTKDLNFISDERFFSSVFCRGSNHTDRLCRFKNLCYDPKSESYLFFLDPRSVVSGVPPDRFTPTLVDFSSTYDHNTLYFNYIEVPSVYTTEFNFSFIPGNSFILKRFNPDNLMHVFHDDLIPIFVTLAELSSNDSFLVFADNRPPGPYADLYENFLNSKPLYISSLPVGKIHCFGNAFVGLNKHSTWYQYGFKSPQGPLSKNRNDLTSSILNFRDYFVKRFSLKQPTLEKKAVVLVRKQNRKILNLAELCQELFLSAKLQTSQISLEKASVLQIIQEIRSARVLIGIHGSLLVLSMFLPSSSVVLELFPYGIDPMISTPYRTLVEIPGLNLIYKSLKSENEANSVSHPEYPKELGGIQHLSLEEQEQIQNSVVQPFLCCEDPVWLYRIYQDTVVDLPSLISVLKEVLQMRSDQLNSPKKVGHQLYYPSEVQNLTCSADKVAETDWICEWDPPWNLKFLKPVVTEYEVWIQDMSTQDVKAFLMKRNSYKFSAKSRESAIYVWVRTNIDGRAGPFNSVPFTCF